MGLPRRGVVLADPGLAEAELVGPAQRLKIPLVAVIQPPLGRVRRHREQAVLHGDLREATGRFSTSALRAGIVSGV
jgi:hypothetical protein